MHEIGSIYSLTQAQKHFSVNVRTADCYANDLGLIPGQVCHSFENFILLTSTN